jgi:hypothetical protein
MLKKLIAICMLSLAVACASGPSAQKTLDVAEDALTTACEQAMFQPTMTKFSADVIEKIATSCSAGGRAIMNAQAAYAIYTGVPDENKAEWYEKMQLSLSIVRMATSEILTYIGAN